MLFNGIKHRDHGVARQPLADTNREALMKTVSVLRREDQVGVSTSAVEEQLGHEVHASALIEVSRFRPLLFLLGDLACICRPSSRYSR